METDINSLVKLHFESELLARGANIATNAAKKTAITALKIGVGVPASIIAAIKLGELSGRKINEI